MKIKNHRLFQDNDQAVSFTASPNKNGELKPKYLVMHYAASSSFQGAVNSLINPAVKVSAHLVIGRDGEIAQLVPFNRVAWHAGASAWEGLSGLNRHTIGIELDNAGKLERSENQWRAWFGAVIPAADVIEAAHKNGGPSTGWHRYPPKQLETAIEVGRALVTKYGLLDIVGHDDIAPGRKIDPGPAFPMASVRARLYGRDEDAIEFTTTTGLNIRTGPGPGFDKVLPNGLPKGSRVTIIEEQNVWRHVDVLDTINGENDITGWLHGRFLVRT